MQPPPTHSQVPEATLRPKRTPIQTRKRLRRTFAIAIEHNRRQHLIITALEQEQVIVDQHIAEAQSENLAIQRTALLLAEKVLAEQWNKKLKH